MTPLDRAKETTEIASTGAHQRLVVVHYHLFKNAGTSLDRTLRAYAREGWLALEAPSGESELMPAVLQRVIETRPDVRVISSHTARLTPLLIPGVKVLPVIFLRHPIDRIMSAYLFERQQQADTLGAKQAKALDFAAYVRFFLERPNDRRFRNFQVSRLQSFDADTPLPEFDRARRTVDALPFVGVVEQYSRSLARIAQQVRPEWPDFETATVTANAGKRPESIEERLAEIRSALGPTLYAQALDANLADLALWLHAQLRNVEAAS